MTWKLSAKKVLLERFLEETLEQEAAYNNQLLYCAYKKQYEDKIANIATILRLHGVPNQVIQEISNYQFTPEFPDWWKFKQPFNYDDPYSNTEIEKTTDDESYLQYKKLLKCKLTPVSKNEDKKTTPSEPI